MKSEGQVYIVGAGPGDPELLTVKSRRLIREADVVLHDCLVEEGVIDLIPPSVERLDVGKNPNGNRTLQTTINQMMTDRAHAGEEVVRLKGGDPCVFGRGGEEAEYLAAHGVEFEIVPGVSSVVASGAHDIPLTHRDHSSSFTVVTGHEDPSKPESSLDWNALASNVTAGGTLVILMGVGKLPDNVQALKDDGVSEDTPVAMVEKATMDSHVVTSTIGEIVEEARSADIEPPAVTIVGDVVEVKEKVLSALSSASQSSVIPKEVAAGKRT